MYAVTVACALAVALGACSKTPVRRPGEEYLKTITVEGNQRVAQKQLTSGLALQRAKDRGRAPDPYLVQVDAERIRGEYMRRGYLGIDVRSRVDRVGPAATVVYTVEEGPRAATRVVIRGLPHDPELPLTKVRAALPLAEGAPFEYAKFDEAKPMLLGAVRDAGYAHATLDAQVFADRANHVAIVQLDFTPGPKCAFGTVEITGVKGDLADAVRARLAFSPGERYSTRAIAATQRQLYGLGRFSTVQVQSDEQVDSVVGVTVAVSQSARREIRLGGGGGLDPTAYEIRGRAGYTIVGWPFPMHTASVDLRPAYAYLRDGGGWEPRVRANAKLERQDFLWTYARGEIKAGYNYLAIEAYTSYGPNAGLGFLTPVKTQRLQLGVGWNIEHLDFRNVSPLLDEARQLELGLDGSQRNGSYNQSLTIDLRDHPLKTRYGAYGELRVTEGTKAAGGSYSYVQVIPEVRGYVPLGPVVLAGRFRYGAFFGDVPVTERFFSGGASNHRGFGERRLAPSITGEIDGESHTVPLGGVALVETGAEARIPIATWRTIGIGTVAFVDGGDVRDARDELFAQTLHWAAGVGLRLQTIVGPVRVDFGYRLNRHGDDEPAPRSRFAFHLSLGEAY